MRTTTSKRITIEKGEDAQNVSLDVPETCKIYVDDHCVYDSEIGVAEQEDVEYQEEFGNTTLGSCLGWGILIVGIGIGGGLLQGIPIFFIHLLR